MTTTNDVALQEIFSDPVLFGEVALRHRYWSMQRTILRSVRDNQRTAVKACNGSGKTYLAADCALWWLSKSHDNIVITTAPTAVLVEKQLWGYIRRTCESLFVPRWKINLTEIRISPNNYAIGLSTNESERFQGFHGNILIIVDEAPGIREVIYTAIEGNRSGGNVKLLLLGNPTIPGGTFYEAFEPHVRNWNTYTIDAFDTPNLRGLTLQQLLELPEHEITQNPWPDLTTRGWVREKYYEWGEDSPKWQARVRGQFPTQSAWSIFPLPWLQSAHDSLKFETCQHEWIAGIDVAGGGRDETAICYFCRLCCNITGPFSWSLSDARGPVLASLKEYEPQQCNVDDSGIGHYFSASISDSGFTVVPINFGSATSDPSRFSIYKDELYWTARDYFERREVHGLQDRETIGQAISAVYRIDNRGRAVVETKEAARRRGIDSPDKLESLILALAPVQGGSFDVPDMQQQRQFATRQRSFRV